MNLPLIQSKIARACKAAGRNTDAASLIAVSKNQTPDTIRLMLQAGQRRFGENRIQDAMEKWPPLRAEFPDVELHFIGQLQSNKAKEAVSLFDVIHTLDRVSLAEALHKEMQKQNRTLPCFIQINTGDEPQKGGIAPADLENFYRFCQEETDLKITGLMCIPPAEEVPDMHFALLHKLGADLGLPGLSMGMSADFEIAIRYGATYVRIGSVLFDVMKN